MTIFLIHSYTFRSQNTYKQLIIGVVTKQEIRLAHAHCSYVATEFYKPQDRTALIKVFAIGED